MKTLIALFVAAALAAPVLAQSAEGFIVADINLQSGPDDDYPPVERLAAGTPVAIEGCIEGWTWCDVIVGDLRGWVPGTYVEENYGGRWVYITDYGPSIGLPVVVFSLNTYWVAHYRDRPWFGERERWAARQIQPRMPARPPGEAHAPAQRPMPSTAPAVNPPSNPSAAPQANPGNAPPKIKNGPVESRPQREAKPSPQSGGAPVPPQRERTMPTAPPAAEPAQRPPPPKSASSPPTRPEAKPKVESKPPAKKENQDHREENNGHDA